MSSETAAPVDFVTYEVIDRVAWVMLNRPQYGNAQNYRMLAQLDAAFKRAAEDDNIAVIVLGGEGAVRVGRILSPPRAA